MSDGDWRHKLTLGIAVAFYLAWAGVGILSAVSIPSIEYQPAECQTEAERDQTREQADTEAQIWMAYAAWAQVGVGVLGLFGLGVTIYFARNAWLESREAARQAKRSADAAEQQLHEADRGRLFVKVDQDTISFTGTEENIPQIYFTLQNVGARHVVLRAARVGLVLQPRAERRTPAWPKRLSTSASTVHPILLKVGEEAEIDGTFYGADKSIRAENWPGIEDRPFFFGSILYTDHFDIWREYKFCFECHSPSDDWEGMIQFRWAQDEPVKDD